MERSSIDTALDAANIALQGKRAQATRRLTSIELREVDSNRAAWEVGLAAAAGIMTFAVMLALLLH